MWKPSRLPVYRAVLAFGLVYGNDFTSDLRDVAPRSGLDGPWRTGLRSAKQ